MLSVVMLSVVMQNVVMLNVVAPSPNVGFESSGPSGTVVEHSTHYPRIKGLNPAGCEKML
jgi:hypothetical protein